MVSSVCEWRHSGGIGTGNWRCWCFKEETATIDIIWYLDNHSLLSNLWFPLFIRKNDNRRGTKGIRWCDVVWMAKTVRVIKLWRGFPSFVKAKLKVERGDRRSVVQLQRRMVECNAMFNKAFHTSWISRLPLLLLNCLLCCVSIDDVHQFVDVTDSDSLQVSLINVMFRLLKKHAEYTKAWYIVNGTGSKVCKRQLVFPISRLFYWLGSWTRHTAKQIKGITALIFRRRNH